MSKILLRFQDKVLKEIPLDKEILTIGRKPGNNIHIENLAVSGFHAKVFKDGDRFIIEDLGSLNGTFVNGKKISRHVLRNGDSAIIGKHTLGFVLPETEDAVEQAITERNIKVDETLVLDAQLQQKILNKTYDVMASGGGRDVLGGFTVIEGPTYKSEYELKDRVTTIGKAPDSAIRMKGLFAPRVAALVNRRKEGYFINAVGGTTVKVNGEKIAEKYDLKDGDIVEVGKIRMQFYIKE